MIGGGGEIIISHWTQTWGEDGEGIEGEEEEDEDGGEEERSFSLQLTWVSPVSTRIPAIDTNTESRILHKHYHYIH